MQKLLALDLALSKHLAQSTFVNCDPDSPVHTRAYFGVRSETAGWISNPSMKLIYLLENGDIVTNILEETFKQDLGHAL